MLQLVLIQLAAWFAEIRFPRPVRTFFANEAAQDTFEYLLIIGVLVVAIIGAAIAGPKSLITTVVGDVTTAVGNLFTSA